MTYTTYEEVQNATNKLDIASLVPLSISDNGVVKPVDNFLGIYNNSLGKFCNVVTPTYKLVQHKEYIDNFAAALDRLNIKYSLDINTAQHKVFADFNFIEKNHKFEKLNEEFATGIRIINSYNKTTGLGIQLRYTRLACTNGMVLSRSETVFSVKHTSKLLNELESLIEKKINSIINNSEELQNWVSGCMIDSVEWRLAVKVLEKIIIPLNHREEILKRLNITVIHKKEKNKKKQFEYINETEKTAKRTRWEIYNAITHYLTHGEHISPIMNSHYHKIAEKVLITPIAQIIE